MSRRHNASRRRNYGRRQHEVRERRSEYSFDGDPQSFSGVDDFRAAEFDEERTPTTGAGDYGAADGYGGARL